MSLSHGAPPLVAIASAARLLPHARPPCQPRPEGAQRSAPLLGLATAAATGAWLRQNRRQRLASSRIARRARAWRPDLPPNWDEEIIPYMNVLYDAVKVKDPEDVVLPSWKMKPPLGIYSPTPQYAPFNRIHAKPFYQKSNFVRRKMKKFYKKLQRQDMEEEGWKARYLLNPKDRLTLASEDLTENTGVFRTADSQIFKTIRKLSAEELMDNMENQKKMRLGLASKPVPLNWRPGWQQVMERNVTACAKRADIIVEVRDARIPFTSRHPEIPDWVNPKPRIIVLAKADLVPKGCLEESIEAIQNTPEDQGIPVIPVDAQHGGKSIEVLRQEMLKAGAYVNRRRMRKDVNPRAIRAMILGFPNVGKSSIINCVTRRKAAHVTKRAGMTRQLRVHLLGGYKNTELEFMDTPGLIPIYFGKRYTPEQSAMLCMCRCFDEKVIDREKTAYELIELLGKLYKTRPHMVDKTVWRETKRIYKVDLQKALRREGPVLPRSVPIDNPAPFCGKMIADFNWGHWGKVQLEMPPDVDKSNTRARQYSMANGTRKPAAGLLKARQAAAGAKPAALPAPKGDFRMPGQEGQRARQKVPVPAEAAFEGW